MTAIEFVNVSKNFGKRKVINNLSFSLEEGEFVSLVGPSGSGKSTILNIIGLFEKFESGHVKIFGKNIPSPDSRSATKLRRETINYLFQSFALINHLTVGQNLLFAMKFTRASEESKLKEIKQVLTSLQIDYLLDSTVNTLSGGEQQRVSLARAMVKPGNIVLADEPTGALDPQTSEVAFDLIKTLRGKYGKTILMVTHNTEEARKTDRVVDLRNFGN